MKNIWILIISILVSACESKPKPKPTTGSSNASDVQSKKLISKTSPTSAETFKLGATVTIDYELIEEVDSVKIFVDNLPIPTNKYVSKRVGAIPYRVVAYKDKSEYGLSGAIAVFSNKTPDLEVVKVIKTYEHNIDAYTQGLLFHDGKLYESTGERGYSSIREVELANGKVLRKRDLEHKYFGEGLALLKEKLYQLTWEEGVIFVYDVDDFDNRSELPLSGEGWGVTTDGEYLYISDGSTRITKYDPRNITKVSQIEVADHQQTIMYINELEWINGKIWANVYTSDMIAVINPLTGVVEKYIDCSKLFSMIGNQNQADVLNGIAYDQVTGRIFLTGKNWDTLFEITI